MRPGRTFLNHLFSGSLEYVHLCCFIVCTTQNQKAQCSGKETILKMLSNGQLKTTKCI